MQVPIYVPTSSPLFEVNVLPPSLLYLTWKYGVLPSAPALPAVPFVPSLTVCVCVPFLSVIVMVVTVPLFEIDTVGDTPSFPSAPIVSSCVVHHGEALSDCSSFTCVIVMFPTALAKENDNVPSDAVSLHLICVSYFLYSVVKLNSVP